MREILFRGKRVDNGEWVEGIFYQHPLTKECFVGVHDYNSYSIAYMGNLGCPVFNKVDPATIGQYTGMKDKNGKRIFEGDIIKAKIEGGNHEGFTWQNMPVGFQQGAFCLNDQNGRVFCVLGAFAPSVSLEVIGNIHDNPELLKGGD